MSMKTAATCIVVGALMLPIAGYAADLASEEASAKTYIKDSVITTQVKTDIAETKLSTLVDISVDTNNGMVVLTGTAPSRNAVDKAVSIARAVKGVTSVESHIRIAADK